VVLTAKESLAGGRVFSCVDRRACGWMLRILLRDCKRIFGGMIVRMRFSYIRRIMRFERREKGDGYLKGASDGRLRWDGGIYL